MITARTFCFAIFGLALASCSGQDKNKQVMEIRKEAPAEPTGKVEKSDAEWKKLLTPEQYATLRESATERPHGAIYEEVKHQGKGTYHCAACGALLFSSKEKFNSDCGWPSFYDPAKAENVKLTKDVSMGMTRIEVTCAKCGSHLGHVFEGEGYKTPTDKRFCINGGGLVFVPAKEDASTSK